MYFPAKVYECQKCDFTFKWSQHHDPIGLGKEFCHKCYLTFIENNVPYAKLKEPKC